MVNFLWHQMAVNKYYLQLPLLSSGDKTEGRANSWFVSPGLWNSSWVRSVPRRVQRIPKPRLEAGFLTANKTKTKFCHLSTVVLATKSLQQAIEIVNSNSDTPNFTFKFLAKFVFWLKSCFSIFCFGTFYLGFEPVTVLQQSTLSL